MASSSFVEIIEKSGYIVGNGMILLAPGIIGEYIGRIYDEAKGRPLYSIDEKAGF